MCVVDQLQQSKVLARWRKVHAKFALHALTVRKEPPEVLRARICGYLAGDGSISKRFDKVQRKMHHDIVFYPDNESVAKNFICSFEALYGKRPKMLNLGNYFKVRTELKPACVDLLKEGSFRSLEWSIPKFVLKNKELMKEWLRAFFDCESYVGPRIIQVQSVNKEGLIHIQKVLKTFGVESRIYEYKRKNPNWNINYLLSIMKLDSRLKYLKTIGFNHPIKQQKLEGYVANVA